MECYCHVRQGVDSFLDESAACIIIIISIIIIINCNWVITRWQWLLYMYTNMEKK